MGYHMAGWEVVGVDIAPQPHYPFEFHQADALTYPLDGFDAVHASPPCQRWSTAGGLHGTQKQLDRHPDLIGPTRERLRDWGGVYVIENVMGAPMQYGTIVLCGLMFGLKVFRHRAFESNILLLAPEHPSHKGHRIGVDGMCCCVGNGGYSKRWRGGKLQGRVAEWKVAMGIDWMTRREMSQAIPPAYTRWIGRILYHAWRQRS